MGFKKITLGILITGEIIIILSIFDAIVIPFRIFELVLALTTISFVVFIYIYRKGRKKDDVH